MTVFVWTDTTPGFREDWSKDEFSTNWAQPTARCLFCGEGFRNGQKAWHWQGDDAHIRAHADCVKARAPGLLLDIAACLR